jgi:TP901 family phage tail tape measure protein
MADELSILMRLRGARKVNAELEGTAASIAKVNRQAKASAAPMMRMSRSMERTGTLLTRRLSLPLALAGAASGKMAYDFETSMTRIETLVGVSHTQVTAWKEDLLNLSKETAVAPRELADALYFVTSSGIPLNKTLDVMEAVAKGAALGLGDTATVAQVVTSSMNAYADSNLTATQTMDTLIAGTKAGKLEASDLAESLGRVLPIASRLGVPLSQVVAGMEAMSLTGADAEQAATQTSAFFSGLVKVTPASAKALKSVGLSAAGLRDDLANPSIGLPGVIKKLDAAFNGNIETMAKIFPNIRAMRTQLGLTGDQAENVARVFHETATGSGALGDSWDKLSKSDAMKLRKGINAIRVAAVRLGEKLGPMALKVAKVIEKLTDLISGHPSAGVSLLFALILLGPALRVAAFGFRIAAASMFGATLATEGYTGSLFMATVAQYGLTAAILASPITWIVLGLAAIALGFFILYQKCATFRHIVQATWSWIKKHWRLLAVIILGPMGLAIVVLVNHFKSVKRIVVTVFNWVVKLAKKIADIAAPLGKVVGIAKGAAGFVGGGIGKVGGVLGGLAGGGPVTRTGPYLVGERGPEIVSVPAGSHVTPNAAAGTGELVTVPVQLIVDGRVLAETTARVVADRKARR